MLRPKLVTITTGQSFVEYFQQGALLNAIGKSQNSLAFPQGVPGTFGLKPVVIVTNFGLKSVVPVVLLVLLVLLALPALVLLAPLVTQVALLVLLVLLALLVPIVLLVLLAPRVPLVLLVLQYS